MAVVHTARSIAARSVHYRTFTQVHAASHTLWLTIWAAKTDATC
jgi:hypothetical protein